MTGYQRPWLGYICALCLLMVLPLQAQEEEEPKPQDVRPDQIRTSFGFDVKGRIVQELPDSVLIVVDDRVLDILKQDIERAYLAVENPDYDPEISGSRSHLLMPVRFPRGEVSEILKERLDEAAQSDFIGTLTFRSQGLVNLKRSDASSFEPIGEEDEDVLLSNGDTLQTLPGGRARATLNDGLQLHVNEDSFVSIGFTELDNSLVTLAGRGSVSVDKGGYFKIVSGRFQLTSEGARVRMSYDSETEEMEVQVFRGTAHLTAGSGLAVWLGRGHQVELAPNPLTGATVVRSSGAQDGVVVVPTGQPDELQIRLARGRAVEIGEQLLLPVAIRAEEVEVEAEEADSSMMEESEDESSMESGETEDSSMGESAGESAKKKKEKSDAAGEGPGDSGKTAPQAMAGEPMEEVVVQAPHVELLLDNGAELVLLANGTYWMELPAEGSPRIGFSRNGWLSIPDHLHLTLTADPDPIAFMPEIGAAFNLQSGKKNVLPQQNVEQQLPRIRQTEAGNMAHIRVAAGSCSYTVGEEEARILSEDMLAEVTDATELQTEAGTLVVVHMSDGAEIQVEGSTRLRIELSEAGNASVTLHEGTVRVRKGGYFQLLTEGRGEVRSKAADVTVRKFPGLLFAQCNLGRVYVAFDAAAGWVPANQTIRFAANPGRHLLEVETLESVDELVVLLPRRDVNTLQLGLTGSRQVKLFGVEYSEQVVVAHLPGDIWLRLYTDLEATLRYQPGEETLWAVFPDESWLKFPPGFKATLRPNDEGHPEVRLPSGSRFKPTPSLEGTRVGTAAAGRKTGTTSDD